MEINRKLKTKTLSMIVALLFWATLIEAAVPQQINYQGILTDAAGTPLDGTYTIRFYLYDALTGGTLLWNEEQSVVVVDGIYNVQLGSMSPLDSDVFAGDEVYLEVIIYNAAITNWEALTPRQQLTSTAYAFQAENAQSLEGHGSTEFASATHQHSGVDISTGTVDEARIDSDIARDSEISWSNLSSIPAGFADDIDNTGITTETDPTVNPSVKDGVSWGELSGIPAGFADNVDNNSGGTITGVTAGTGITGGGSSGNVTVHLQVPIDLSGNHTNGIISGRHTANNNFARIASAWEGLFAQSDAGRGVVGWSNSNDGVRGQNLNSSNYGILGSSTYGVYGNGNWAAVYGENPNGHVGYLGGLGAGVYGEGNTWAGYFDGKINVTGRATVQVLEITGGADLSEQFDVRAYKEDLEPSPGMVVSIDPESPGNLVVSNRAYDRKVAGIISGAGNVKPGMLMGQKGSKANGTKPVALTGRVYCMADASYGRIEPGDLLTTSQTPGHAMKVTDYRKALGSTIGKAMTSLEKGKGLLLVLVSLQ